MDGCGLDPQIHPATFVGSLTNFYSHSLPSADSRRVVVSYWQKNMHWVLVNSLDGLPKNSVDRLPKGPKKCRMAVKHEHSYIPNDQSRVTYTVYSFFCSLANYAML